MLQIKQRSTAVFLQRSSKRRKQNFITLCSGLFCQQQLAQGDKVFSIYLVVEVNIGIEFLYGNLSTGKILL